MYRLPEEEEEEDEEEEDEDEDVRAQINKRLKETLRSWISSVTF